MPETRAREVSSWWLSAPGLLLLAALASGAVAWWLIAYPVATTDIFNSDVPLP